MHNLKDVHVWNLFWSTTSTSYVHNGQKSWQETEKHAAYSHVTESACNHKKRKYLHAIIVLRILPRTLVEWWSTLYLVWMILKKSRTSLLTHGLLNVTRKCKNHWHWEIHWQQLPFKFINRYQCLLLCHHQHHHVVLSKLITWDLQVTLAQVNAMFCWRWIYVLAMCLGINAFFCVIINIITWSYQSSLLETSKWHWHK